MQLTRVSKILIVLGALVGSLAGVAMILRLRLDQLPPWMITVGMYKLAFLAAGGLFAAGALLGRVARNRATRLTDRQESDRTQAQVGPGAWQPSGLVGRTEERASRSREDK